MRIKRECFPGPNFPKNRFWGLKFENLTPDLESALPRRTKRTKRDNIAFFIANLSKNKFWSQNFKNLSLDLESAPPRYHVCQFSGKTESFDFFSSNLSKNGFRVGNSES